MGGDEAMTAPAANPSKPRPSSIITTPRVNGCTDASAAAGSAEEPGSAEEALKTPTLAGPFSPSLYAPAPDWIDPLIALAPTPSNLSSLAFALLDQAAPVKGRSASGGSPTKRRQSTVSEAQVRKTFTDAFLKASSSGDADLLEWLIMTPSSATKKGRQSWSYAAYDHGDGLTMRPTVSRTPRPGGHTAHATAKPASSRTDPPKESVRSSSRKKVLAPGEARQWVDLEAKDEEGAPPLVLAATFGHAEAVRAIVEGLGEETVDVRDASGWTALHWASRNGDFTIVSYLLNHGATTDLVSYSGLPPSSSTSSVSAITLQTLGRRSSSSTLASEFSTDTSRIRRTRGLRPYDLARRGPEGDSVRHVIAMAEESRRLPGLPTSPSCESLYSEFGPARSLGDTRKLPKGSQARSETKAEEITRLKLEFAVESARALDLDFTLLGFNPAASSSASAKRFSTASSIHDSPPPEEDDSDEGEDSDGLEPFDYSSYRPDQVFIISPDDLPTLFDVAISFYDPVRTPKRDRGAPASVLYLSARWAGSIGSMELLEDLLLGALDRIEESIHNRGDGIAHCAFWLHNATLLLYYLRRDERLSPICEDYHIHLSDLINELFVYIIRDAERRLDKVLAAGMLEFEPMPGLGDVEFEGEGLGSWRLVKRSLGIGTGLSGAGGRRTRQSSAKGEPPGSPSTQNGMKSPHSSPRPDSGKLDKAASTLKSHRMMSNVASLPSTHAVVSPRTVTTLLSSVLFVLQSYALHPSVVVQAFSQIFYWLSCECFNRILTRRKYLCRSKALQIRINMSSLDDWVRINHLPIKIFTTHFNVLNHLLQWLQCLSSEEHLADLVGTMNQLSSLNPLQMLKASREYRFEVDEGRMSEECRQYLVQTQQDWEKRRRQKSEEAAEREQAENDMLAPAGLASPKLDSLASPTSTESRIDSELVAGEVMSQEATRAVDKAFGIGDWTTYGQFVPPSPPQILGELLDSRYMLPFALPTALSVLVPLRERECFGPFANPAGAGEEASQPPSRPNSRPPSIASFDLSVGEEAEARPNPTQPREPEPHLPDGFLAKLDAARKRSSALRVPDMSNSSYTLRPSVSGPGSETV